MNVSFKTISLKINFYPRPRIAHRRTYLVRIMFVSISKMCEAWNRSQEVIFIKIKTKRTRKKLAYDGDDLYVGNILCIEKMA